MYTEKILSNGIRVAAERIPYVKSVSLGVWVANGSRCETAEESGISHFIEHMVFKGTRRRSARDIALEMDAVGGQINAFTTRECTCFYAKTLNECVETSADILSDMVFEPRLSAGDMELERRVILEEIAMYEDSPEDVVYDLFAETVWGRTAMGRPITGTEETLSRITPDIMREYMRRHYTSRSIVIAAAGGFDDSLFDMLERYFGGRSLADCEPRFEDARYCAANAFSRRDFEQIQLVAGFSGIDIYDDAVYPLLVFNNIFGSGMSSRLFQNIREKYGLVYSISAGHSAYIGTGTFDINVAASPENMERVAELVMKEIRSVKLDKLTGEEIERAKLQLKRNYILSNESISNRMQTIGRFELLGKPHITQEETIKNIMAVDSAAISEIIDRVLDVSTLSIVAAGPADGIERLTERCSQPL